MISPGLLDYLRSVQQIAMPDTAAILRYTEVNTPDGVEQGWQVVASGIPCRVDAHRMTAGELLGAGGAVLQSVSSWAVHLPALTDVTVKDRITVTFTETGATRTYEVSDVGEQSYETERDCACALVG
jgi:hypothetical protein